MKYSRFKTKSKVGQDRIVVMGDKYWIPMCWKFVHEKYPRLEGSYLHTQYAHGQGEVVRHLCSDSRCVNPLHLVRGSDVENARDEIAIRDFAIHEWMKILTFNDSQTLDLDEKPEILYLVLQARVGREIEEYKGRSNLDAYKDMRKKYNEIFQRSFMASYIQNEEFSQLYCKQLEACKVLYGRLRSRYDITIIHGRDL